MVCGLSDSESKRMKSEQEMREKLEEMLSLDARIQQVGMVAGMLMHSKAAACKTLLWALGENDDDRWFIRAKPGPPEDIRVKARN